MKILGLIPARGGSKGIPRKNIKVIGGKPLIAYAIEMGLKSESIDLVMVSTEDDEIATISQQFGAQVPVKRPEELARDDSPTIDSVVHAVKYYLENGNKFDAVCLLQPTSPFRTVKDIDNAVKIFEETNADSLISVVEVPHQFNPYWVFVPIENNSSFLSISTGDEKIISRRQALPKAYYRNGAIYLVRTDIVLEQNSLYGDKIAYYEMPSNQAINIDTKEDWKKAENYIVSNKL